MSRLAVDMANLRADSPSSPRFHQLELTPVRLHRDPYLRAPLACSAQRQSRNLCPCRDSADASSRKWQKHPSPRNVHLPFRGAPLIFSASITTRAHAGGQRCRCYPTPRTMVRRICTIFCSPTIPNTFNRAAELALIYRCRAPSADQPVILDHRLIAALFISDYIAGAYFGPLAMPAASTAP